MNVSLQYDLYSARFFIQCSELALEVICIILYFYCFVATIRITSKEHKTSQYQKYQWLRILLILLCLCYILRAVNVLFIFIPEWLEKVIQGIGATSDTIFSIVTIITIWQIGILLYRYRYSPRSCWYKLLLFLFFILCFIMNILDVIRVIMDDVKLADSIWVYFQFSIIPIGLIVTVILLSYYCRLRQYVKGETMVATSAASFILDSFRTKMLIEYKKACILIIGTVLFFIVWTVGLILLTVEQINDKYLQDPIYLALIFLGNIFHRIGFSHYLWVRYEPLKDDDFMKKSMEQRRENHIVSNEITQHM